MPIWRETCQGCSVKLHKSGIGYIENDTWLGCSTGEQTHIKDVLHVNRHILVICYMSADTCQVTFMHRFFSECNVSYVKLNGLTKVSDSRVVLRTANIKWHLISWYTTRKSSCVHARGIPTTAYQVLHLFPKVGSGQIWWGWYLRWGTPQQGYSWPGPKGEGVPEVGYPLAGVPPARSKGGYLRWGTPRPGPMGGTWDGVPPGWTWLGYPPLGVDRQMDGWMDGWKDTCEKITLPLYYVRGR